LAPPHLARACVPDRKRAGLSHRSESNPAILHPGNDLETENVVIKPFRRVEIARVNRGLAQLTEPHLRRMSATDVADKARLRLTSQETKLSRDMQEFGKLLVGLGGLVLLLGLALWSGFGAGWLGRLPGDIRIVREHSAFISRSSPALLLASW
jgi:hypothetical protein